MTAEPTAPQVGTAEIMLMIEEVIVGVCVIVAELVTVFVDELVGVKEIVAVAVLVLV